MKEKHYEYVIKCYNDGKCLGTIILSVKNTGDLYWLIKNTNASSQIALNIFEKTLGFPVDVSPYAEIGPPDNCLYIKDAIYSDVVSPYGWTKLQNPYYVTKCYEIDANGNKKIITNTNFGYKGKTSNTKQKNYYADVVYWENGDHQRSIYTPNYEEYKKVGAV